MPMCGENTRLPMIRCSHLPTLSKENHGPSPTRRATAWNKYVVFLLCIGVVVVVLGTSRVVEVGWDAAAGDRMDGVVASKNEITILRSKPETAKKKKDEEVDKKETEFATEFPHHSDDIETTEEAEIKEAIIVLDDKGILPTETSLPSSASSCAGHYQVIAFNSAGYKIVFRERWPAPSTNTIASEFPVEDGTIGVLALGVVPGAGEEGCLLLEGLAELVDDFLTPRLEWRIVAERFETTTPTLFYDPVMHSSSTTIAMEGYSSRVLTRSAVIARRTLLDELNKNTSAISNTTNDDEVLLQQNGIDFILVRVQDEQTVALAAALRRHQFPSMEDCAAFEARTLGRTVVVQGGARDFLGAWTATNTDTMMKSMQAGLPFVSVLPPVWGRVYHFDQCTRLNGIECGFLPIQGGTCLARRVVPAIACLSRFQTGALERMVLPRAGIPDSVCHDSIEQRPAPALDDIPEDKLSSYNCEDPPEAYRRWCPNCGFGGDEVKPSAALLGNATAVLNFGSVAAINQDLPVRNYYDLQTRKDFLPPARNCGLEIPPLLHNGGTCCYDELFIPQNVLGISDADEEEKRPSTKMIGSAISAFQTRFNRASRRRVATLHQPRVEAMHARQQGWKEVLAVGNCATLHIRRGDNIDRCQKGETHFCSMNLTLADYMDKAVPMLTQLNESKHVFIMTDDPEVASIEHLEPWVQQGYVLEVISGHNQYSKETYSDYDPFLESLYAAEACRAMVGHYISTVSLLVFRKMCARWGECPIVDMMHNPPPKPTT